MDSDDNHALCALRRRLAVCDKYPTLVRAEILTHHISGVFLGRKASFLVTRGGCESFRKGKEPIAAEHTAARAFDGPDSGT